MTRSQTSSQSEQPLQWFKLFAHSTTCCSDVCRVDRQSLCAFPRHDWWVRYWKWGRAWDRAFWPKKWRRRIQKRKFLRLQRKQLSVRQSSLNFESTWMPSLLSLLRWECWLWLKIKRSSLLDPDRVCQSRLSKSRCEYFPSSFRNRRSNEPLGFEFQCRTSGLGFLEQFRHWLQRKQAHA